MILRIASTFLFLFLAITAWSQLVEFPVPRNLSSTQKASARIQNTTPISLPFWDDFSWATSDKPDSLWMNSETVSVNNGNGINAPSIKVATFDGLNETGTPYTTNPQESLAFGYTDSLISRPIKMTEVPLAQRNTVFLSFFYQWSGYGETPDARDFLELSFKDNTSTWQSMLTLRATQIIKPDTFYHVMIRINQSEFYHDNFQFKLQSSGRKSGYYDLWNVDYVYLDKDRNASITDYADKTISSSMGPTFKNKYYSVPLNHFYFDSTANISFINMTFAHLSSEQPESWNYTITADIKAIAKDESTTFINQHILFDDTNSPLNVLEFRNLTLKGYPDLSPFYNYDSLIELTVNVSIDTGETSFDRYTGRYKSKLNNTSSQLFILKNYYAYDDGSAEATAGLGGSGNSVGQKAVIMFPMLTNQRDTINGVSAYFAYHGQAAPSQVELLVYDCVNGEPRNLLHSEVIPSQQQTLNNFLTYKLQQGIPVKDTFFIGWEEIQQGKIARIGLDKNNNTATKLFYNSNGTWELNDRVNGSLMFRPIFGPAPIFTDVFEESRPNISYYPNPNAGEFIIAGNIQGLKIFNAAGHPVSFTSIEVDLEKLKISFDQPTAGLYLIQYRANAKSYSHKIIVR